ncbi:MAG: heavy metal-associated domain-containing protein [Cyanobacteria bacterium P01_G01_bin.19]
MNWLFKRSPTREIQLQVEDLHCEMCAQTVREALQKVSGVKQVKVNLSKKRVTIILPIESEISVESLIQALDTTGYEAKPILAARANNFS